MHYLSYLFYLDFEYGTIGCQKCAIFAYHEYVDNKSMSQHPHICAFLKGVFNQRSSQPSMSLFHTTFLDFVKCQWSGCDLTDEALTYKVIILMALSSASRASTIRHFDVRYSLKSEENIVFTFHKLHKSLKYGKAPSSLQFYKYTEDRKSCVVTTLNEYIKCTYQGCA